jgi:hypothetical protein
MHAGINPDHPATIDAANTRARNEITRYEAHVQRLVDARLALPFFTLEEVLQVTNAELQAASAAAEEANIKRIAPDLGTLDLRTLREGVEITKIGDWSLLAGEGSLWFRGYARWPEDDTTRPKVTTLLETAGAKRIVVGHTPTPDSRIAARFGGRVVVIDTGMLTPVYKGRPSALEIRGQQLTAIYEDGAVPLTTSSMPAMLVER